MAKTKASGKTRQKTPRPGKRLGIKIFGGQKTDVGQIIVRQRGTNFHPGRGVGVGRDYSLYALKKGTVVYSQKQGKRVISVT